jgi:hypothetical protein
LYSFQAVVNKIFEQLKSDLGPVPGKIPTKSMAHIFQEMLLPKLKTHLKNYGLQNQIRGPLRDCYNTSACQTFLIKGMGFWGKSYKTF